MLFWALILSLGFIKGTPWILDFFALSMIKLSMSSFDWESLAEIKRAARPATCAAAAEVPVNNHNLFQSLFY